jgi:hypothetical protein
MTTSQDNATTPTSPSLLVQFEHYIDDLLLDTNKPGDQGAASPTLDTQAAAVKRKVLWVTESADYAQAQTELKDQDVELINIDMLSQSPPTERYELICFWLPSLRDAEFKTYLATLMHSRDLYAEYTLIVLADSIDLVAYGFVHLDGSPLDAVSTTTDQPKTDNAATQGQLHQLRAWQFNLFDYKPRPHWLNAHYWANPENWGKYRW